LGGSLGSHTSKKKKKKKKKKNQLGSAFSIKESPIWFGSGENQYQNEPAL
jgi:hypothetical protein